MLLHGVVEKRTKRKGRRTPDATLAVGSVDEQRALESVKGKVVTHQFELRRPLLVADPLFDAWTLQEISTWKAHTVKSDVVDEALADPQLRVTEDFESM